MPDWELFLDASSNDCCDEDVVTLEHLDVTKGDEEGGSELETALEKAVFSLGVDVFEASDTSDIDELFMKGMEDDEFC